LAGLAPSGSELLAQAPSSGAPRAQQGTSRDRAALEQQVQRRLAEIARRELKLNEAQFSRLQEVNARFDAERRETIQRERRTRMQLRRELQKGAAADEAAVSRLLDAMLETQRDRLSVLEAEQVA